MRRATLDGSGSSMLPGIPGFSVETTNGSPLMTRVLSPSVGPRERASLCCDGRCLLVILLVGIVDDVEELELVHSLRGRDDTEPVTELHLLEELLGPVVVAVSTLSMG